MHYVDYHSSSCSWKIIHSGSALRTTRSMSGTSNFTRLVSHEALLLAYLELCRKDSKGETESTSKRVFICTQDNRKDLQLSASVTMSWIQKAPSLSEKVFVEWQLNIVEHIEEDLREKKSFNELKLQKLVERGWPERLTSRELKKKAPNIAKCCKQLKKN